MASGFRTLAIANIVLITRMRKALCWFRFLGPYSQHFIFSLTYEWAQQARALNYTWLKGFPVKKHSSLFGTFVSYEKRSFVNKAPDPIRIFSQALY
jgi:hypothetical protein